jgi:hypothetical protein
MFGHPDTLTVYENLPGIEQNPRLLFGTAQPVSENVHQGKPGFVGCNLKCRSAHKDHSFKFRFLDSAPHTLPQ